MGSYFTMGTITEALFKRVMRMDRYIIRDATAYEDRNHHIDLYLQGCEELCNKFEISVDVKGDKKAKRCNNNVMDSIIIVEYVGVEGKVGMIEGKQDAIAFKLGDVFYLLDRKRLRDICYSIAPPDSQTTSNVDEAIKNTILYKRPPDSSRKKDSVHRGIMLYISINKVDKAELTDPITIPNELLQWHDNMMIRFKNGEDIQQEVYDFGKHKDSPI